MVNYKIEVIEGIDTVTTEKLKNVGITTFELLLENTKTKNQRKKLSEKTEIDESLILRFSNMVDLSRICGIGEKYSELLELSGVDTIVELSQRDSDNLFIKISEVNEEKDLTRKLPTLSQVEKWISDAKVLPRMLEY